MSSLINKKTRANDVSLPKPHPQVSSPPLSDLEQRIELISSKLDEGNIKGGIRLAASDDKIAPISADNYQKLLSKHPRRAKFAAPNPEKLDSFFVTDFDLYKAIMSFPNGSAASPDKIIPQIFEDLVNKSNGSAGLNFLKSLTKLINLIGDGKISEPLRPFFFGAKLIALIKIDGGLRPIETDSISTLSVKNSVKNGWLKSRNLSEEKKTHPNHKYSVTFVSKVGTMKET